MNTNFTLGRLWAKKINSLEKNFKTFSYSLDEVPLIVVVNVPSLRFRVFVDSDAKHDITHMLRTETLELIASLLDESLGSEICS